MQESCGSASNYDAKLLFASLLLIVSIVYAEQMPTLNLTLDKNDVDNILSRSDWREPVIEDDDNWREESNEEETSNEQDNSVRVDNNSIYEEDSDLAPIRPDVYSPGVIVDKRRAEPMIQLRF